MLTVKAALEEAMATIERIDAHVLMAHVLGVNRAHLAANPMRVLTQSEGARVDMLVARRALGQPVAYLIEKREFFEARAAVLHNAARDGLDKSRVRCGIAQSVPQLANRRMQAVVEVDYCLAP